MCLQEMSLNYDNFMINLMNFLKISFKFLTKIPVFLHSDKRLNIYKVSVWNSATSCVYCIIPLIMDS